MSRAPRQRSAGATPARVPALLINDTRVDLHHGCTRVIRTIHALATHAGIDITDSWPAHTDWRQSPQCLRALESAPLVIINGEGSIHHDRPAGRWLVEAGDYAQARGTPVALINMSWQANPAQLAEPLRRFAVVATRDARSAAELREQGVACRVVPDLSLYFDPPGFPPRQGTGFTDSVLRDVRADLERLRARLGAVYVPIHYSQPGVRGGVRFVRSYVGKNELTQPFGFMRTLAARLRQYLSQCSDDDAFSQGIAALELLVTGRFHATTFAVAARTPFLAMRTPPGTLETDGHKLAALIEAIGLRPWRLADSSTVSDALLRRAAVWHGDEAARIERYLQRGRRSMQRLFADIRAAVRA